MEEEKEGWGAPGGQGRAGCLGEDYGEAGRDPAVEAEGFVGLSEPTPVVHPHFAQGSPPFPMQYMILGFIPARSGRKEQILTWLSPNFSHLTQTARLPFLSFGSPRSQPQVVAGGGDFSPAS